MLATRLRAPDSPGNEGSTTCPGPDLRAVRYPAPVVDRWPVGPLAEAAGIPTGSDGWASNLARRVGVDRRNVHRWVHDGLSYIRADEAAVALGLHPALVWPGWSPTLHGGAHGHTTHSDR